MKLGSLNTSNLGYICNANVPCLSLRNIIYDTLVFVISMQRAATGCSHY